MARTLYSVAKAWRASGSFQFNSLRHDAGAIVLGVRVRETGQFELVR